MTRYDQRTGARARRRLQAQRHASEVTLYTLAFWTSVGLFVGALMSVAWLRWTGRI